MAISILSLLIVLSYFGQYAAIPFLDFLEDVMERNDPPFKYLIERSPNGSYQMEDLNIANVLPTASTKDIVVYFYSRSNPKNPVAINITDVSSIGANTNFDTSKESLFIIHGWQNDHTSPVNIVIKDAVLKKHDVNVFVVDWSPFAEKLYVTAYVNVPKVGAMIGEFLKTMSRMYNYPLSKIKVAAHSLGAHVAGITGKVTKGALKHIVGMDPAGPLYKIKNSENRLSKNDARYVEVIHTCGKLLGYYPPLGDSDYYPNGGLSQPGCGFIEDLDGGCSHMRAYEYYAESILSGGFDAINCNNYYISYQLNLCQNNTEATMGGYNLDTKVHGKFYLKTNSSPPYAVRD